MNAIEHDSAAYRFSTDVRGLRAVLDYRLTGKVMTITHTGVPDAISGRGVAADLMRAALKVAYSAGWKVDPQCSYAAAYMRRHPGEASPAIGSSLTPP